MSPHLNGEYLLLNYIIPVCSSYFDIGTNKGEWTDYIISNVKSETAKLHLYEPGTLAFGILSNRFKQNNNIVLSNFAMSDAIGKLTFYEQDNAGELSSAIQKWAYGPGSIIEVETTTIDAELSSLEIEYVDYVKIDTEGFDLKVLKGAQASIFGNKIGFIQFEYNLVWSMTGATLLEAYEILEGGGYKIFLIQPDGLYNYDVKRYGEFYAFSNFIAITQQNLTHVKEIIKGIA